MKTVFDRFKEVIKTPLQRLYITYSLFQENGLANHAAACAYGFLLSMAPMLLLIALIIFFVFRPSPDTIVSLIGHIPVLDSIFDEKWLTVDFFSFSTPVPKISSVIFLLSIIWASRLLAISMQRGLKITFPSEKKRNPVKYHLITLAIEAMVIVLVLIAIISSRLALGFYKLLDFLPDKSILKFITSVAGSQASFVFLMGIVIFFVYLFVPVKAPKRFSAFQGALFCCIAYFCTSLLLGIILDRARYNLLYGTLGNLILILINVYLFFLFFFLGAQLSYVIDSFDALLFQKIRLYRKKPMLYRLCYPRGSNLAKYLRKYGEDEVIIKKGDIVDDVYYLLEGEVEVFGVNRDILKAGSFFGEMGYLLSENRNATVKARTAVTVIAMPPSLFEDILKYDAKLDRVIINDISRRLKQKID